MGCATSHSEDLHKTSLLESDKFLTSLQDVPGYFNRTIHTADFLPPKFPDVEPKKTEMSYTGPPSHLRNSVDFHPYWHLLQQDYIPSGTIHETDSEGREMPSSLLPHTETAQELRDIEVREAITDLRERVKESISSKLRENEEEFFAAISAHVEDYDQPYMEGRPLPPPLPEEDYMDTDETDMVRPGADETDIDKMDSPLAQDEKETIDFLDSVINESMAWDEEVEEEEEERTKGKTENSNWSFASSPSIDEEETNNHDYQQNKPLPGVNLDIASNKSSPNNSPASFSKSIYLPEDRNSFISNEVLARQMEARSGVQMRTRDETKQVTIPQGGGQNDRYAKDSPKRKSVPPPPPKRTSSIVRTNSARVVPPPPTEIPPPPPFVTSPPPPPPADINSVRTNESRINNESPNMDSSKFTKAGVHVEHVPPPAEHIPPPSLSEKLAPPTPQPRQLQSTKSLNRRDSNKAPVSLPPSTKAVAPSLQKTNSLDRRDLSFETAPPTTKVDAWWLEKTKSLDRRDSPTIPPPPAPKPKYPAPGVMPKPVRHSMIEFPSEITIIEDLPSDDSGIKEEVSEKSIHDIIKNLKLADSSTLERKSKGPPHPAPRKPARPVSMPPTAMGPPVVKPKPQRKTTSNGMIPNGRGVGRTASFGPARRTMSDDASSEDSGLHMKEDTDILSQIHLGIPEGQVR